MHRNGPLTQVHTEDNEVEYYEARKEAGRTK